MMVPVVLLLLGVLTAVVAPGLLGRADWTDREPVVALWVWQCVVVGVLLSFGLSMTLSAASAWEAVRGRLFASAPHGVRDAYEPGAGGPWAAATAVLLACGGMWSAWMLLREVFRARARRRLRRAELVRRVPRLPGEEEHADGRLVVLEGERADAWWLPGTPPRLVVTTAALRRLKGRQLDAVLAHEQGHATARHDWLRHSSAALANGFPQVPVFAAFRDQIHRLVELSADDMASRRFGRLTTALALVELNEDRGVFGPAHTPEDHDVPQRVYRLLTPAHRLPPLHRLRLTALAALIPAVPLLVAFVPGLRALG
ncbi:M56 family metallopeptidase [Streptomyces sp. NPDC047000]|uniref:M56 family metallopeptidase n=1 Tax=Streptomyces sp. NPDC047000 TaxID=3155474 RepID=UPI0033EDD654